MKITKINGFQTCLSGKDPFLKPNPTQKPSKSMVWLEPEKAWSLSHLVLPHPGHGPDPLGLRSTVWNPGSGSSPLFYTKGK